MVALEYCYMLPKGDVQFEQKHGGFFSIASRSCSIQRNPPENTRIHVKETLKFDRVFVALVGAVHNREVVVKIVQNKTFDIEHIRLGLIYPIASVIR